MIIETNRLFLREMTENDFEALYKVLSDSDIMKHYPYTFDDTDNIEKTISCHEQVSSYS